MDRLEDDTMQYYRIVFLDEEFWVELNNQGLALRQMVCSKSEIKASCFEDCLAEGTVKIDELEGDYEVVSQDVFEQKWNAVLMPRKNVWESTKEKYKIGDRIKAKMAYHYPQGTIFHIPNGIALYKGKKMVGISEVIEMSVFGYDETNMWIITDD